jgi:hypothetical protein
MVYHRDFGCVYFKYKLHKFNVKFTLHIMQGPNVAAYTTDWWIYIPIHRNAERVAWITANAKRIIAAYYITKSTAIRFWSEELPSNCCV